MQLDEPFREELNNPRAYTSLKIAHFLEFSESSSKTPFLSCTVICVILDHKTWSGSSQRNAPLISDPKSDGIFDPWSRERGVDPTGLFIYYCPSLSISSYDLNTKPILTTFGPSWNCLQLLSLQKKVWDIDQMKPLSATVVLSLFTPSFRRSTASSGSL